MLEFRNENFMISITLNPTPKGTREVGRTRCETCPAGMFQATSGKDNCDICPKGTVADTGAWECTVCPKVV